MYFRHLQRQTSRDRLLVDSRDVEPLCCQAAKSIVRSRSVRDFDLATACPVIACDEVDDFYASQHCVDVLGDVAVPMLFLNSLDDPVIDGSLAKFGIEAAQTNPNVISVVTQRGGHLGWVEDLSSQGESPIRSMHEQKQKKYSEPWIQRTLLYPGKWFVVSRDSL